MCADILNGLQSIAVPSNVEDKKMSKHLIESLTTFSNKVGVMEEAVDLVKMLDQPKVFAGWLAVIVAGLIVKAKPFGNSLSLNDELDFYADIDGSTFKSNVVEIESVDSNGNSFKQNIEFSVRKRDDGDNFFNFNVIGHLAKSPAYGKRGGTNRFGAGPYSFYASTAKAELNSFVPNAVAKAIMAGVKGSI